MPAASGREPTWRPGLEAALAQKSALLHEVDHRVKNNLQLIASLILLQSRRTTDEAAHAALKTVLERVTAVATVHRRLFQGDPCSFDVADFVRDLAADLAAAAGRDDLEIALDLDHVTIPASSAAAFALVVNELLGNALKHAFPAGRPGRIAVGLVDGGAAPACSPSPTTAWAWPAAAGLRLDHRQAALPAAARRLEVADAQPGDALCR